jgi:hypothetical protein
MVQISLNNRFKCLESKEELGCLGRLSMHHAHVPHKKQNLTRFSY